MQLLNLLFLAVASAASAETVAAENASDAQAATTGVVFYEHIHFRGFSYEIPSTGRCWPLPENLRQEVSSVRFRSGGVSCALYKNNFCFPPVLYAGLRESVSDLHILGIGDEVGSVYCGLYQDDE
ncbi:hypothetical protein V2A60_009369 [Cordyceps javanica]|uniref:Uncharacterized protein n=1 Tax=Cordyceps javanica TaxID=43265 RepID=A0A545UP11_9HYPO|nr:hypothetical protein IF1G_10060 [Cordyceps javanica]TQW03028.1 hypothetical protein IF2G_09545 [Cordyceps javanica]